MWVKVSHYFTVFESLIDGSVINLISAVFKANISKENRSQSAREPLHACELMCCVSLGRQRSDSTCLDSMWSPGPAHCSKTLLLLFTTLAVKWKTAACRSTCHLISRHSLAARKHVFAKDILGENTVVTEPNICLLTFWRLWGAALISGSLKSSGASEVCRFCPALVLFRTKHHPAGNLSQLLKNRKRSSHWLIWTSRGGTRIEPEQSDDAA